MKFYYNFYFVNNLITNDITATIAIIIITPIRMPDLNTSPMNSQPEKVKGTKANHNIAKNLVIMLNL